MGDHNIHTQSDRHSRQDFIRHLLDDIQALEQMLERGEIESGITRIGAEQEFFLVDPDFRPAKNAATLLKAIDDPHFTTELARYNLEINLDPIELKGDAFSKVEKQLYSLLTKAEAAAKAHDTRVVLTGILPSLSMKEIDLSYMTDNPRYHALNEMLMKLKGSDFQMHLSGVDELSIVHDSVMFEACNTSFQMHLQIQPDDFIDSYNWAQAISGPVLGMCVNSPILLGRELWQETRVALFQQSIDTRAISPALNDRQARVTFGSEWATGTLVDVFKNEISRYKVILSKDIAQNALDQLAAGQAPKLAALNLHNGTIYRWNRACYGVGKGKAHVRIENRYIPSGPTALDELANFAFWVGLMVGRTEVYNQIHEKMDFKDAKSNFIKAARYGASSMMEWMGESISLRELTLHKLLPMAREGLSKVGIDESDSKRFLDVIEARAKGNTPAEWTIQSYRNLSRKMGRDASLVALTEAIYREQNTDKPLHAWSLATASPSKEYAPSSVGHIMSTALFTAFIGDTAEMTLKIMEWKNIHHLPVVDENEKLMGLLTWTHVERWQKENKRDTECPVSEIMETTIHSAEPDTPIPEAIAKMKKHAIGCLPILQKNHLVGIVTIKDIKPFDHG